MKVIITTDHLKFRSLYLQNAANVRAFNVVRQEKIVVGFSGNVYTGTINRLNLGEGSVEEFHLAKGAVTTPVLADQSVTEAKIRDSNVTLQKLEPSIRNVFREIKPNMNVIVATKDVNEDYHVIRRIYAKDFMIENSDGSLGSIQSLLIDDAKTTGSTTWSSAYIAGRFNEKSDVGHTHEVYSLVSHHHDDLYSGKGHNHDGIYSPSWHDHDTRYYTQYQTNTKLATLKDEVIVASKDERSDYHVERKIYAKDFVVENADGSLSDIQSTIINDSSTSSLTTWSSLLIDSKIREKSDIGHTHEQYPLVSHTHSKSQITDFPASIPVSGGTADNARMVNSENTIRYNVSGLQYFNIADGGDGKNGNVAENPYGSGMYSHNIVLNHANPNGYYTQISTPTGYDDITFRRMERGTFHSWQTLYHSGNINNYNTDWNCKELRTKGRARIGEQTNGTAAINAYNGNAYFGCNDAENGLYVNPNGTTYAKQLIVNPTNVGPGNYNEGLRLVNHSAGWSNIQFGTDTSVKGFVSGQWLIGKQPDKQFIISYAGNEYGTNNLRIAPSGIAYCKDIVALG